MIETQRFGRGARNRYEIPKLFPQRLRLWSGDYVYGIIINNKKFGMERGRQSRGIQLPAGGYWRFVDIVHKDAVSGLHIRSQNGVSVRSHRFDLSNPRSFANGRSVPSGWSRSTLTNVRVLRVGGQIGVYRSRGRGLNWARDVAVTELDIEFVRDYDDPKKIRKALFIVSVEPPGGIITETNESYIEEIRTLEVINKFTRTLNSNAKLNFGSKFADTLGMTGAEFGRSINTVEQFTETVTHEVTRRLNQTTETVRTIEGERTGFRIVECQIFRENNGDYWIWPIGQPSWIELREEDVGQLIDVFDLTGGAAAIQMGARVHTELGFTKIVGTT